VKTLGEIYKEAMFRGAQGGFAPPHMMAEGGVVDEPTEAVVGEDGAEAVIPLEKHPGQSCDEAHPDQAHEEWEEDRKETAGELLGEDQEKEAMDKIAAEMDAAGRIMARGFADEIEKVARVGFLTRPSAGKMGRAALIGLGLGGGALAGGTALAASDPDIHRVWTKTFGLSPSGAPAGGDPEQNARLRKALRLQALRRMGMEEDWKSHMGELGEVSSRMEGPPIESMAPADWLRSLRNPATPLAQMGPEEPPALAPQVARPVGPYGE